MRSSKHFFTENGSSCSLPAQEGASKAGFGKVCGSESGDNAEPEGNEPGGGGSDEAFGEAVDSS
ncbi:MAG: hypothetical protein JXB10_03495 [Pirellulales bacterium]|nr:hypothetical protein [Pirellulales bacterium]